MKSIPTMAVLGALGATVAGALTLPVSFPERARAKIIGIVDEAGNVLFGNTPGKVAVTSLPTDTPLPVVLQGTQNVNIVGGTVVAAPSSTANISSGVVGALTGQNTYALGAVLKTSMLTASSRDRLLVTLSGSGVTLSFEVFPNQTVVLPFPERMPIDQITLNCTDAGNLCTYFSVGLIGSTT